MNSLVELAAIRQAQLIHREALMLQLFARIEVLTSCEDSIVEGVFLYVIPFISLFVFPLLLIFFPRRAYAGGNIY